MHGDCTFDLVDSETLAQASHNITTLRSWRQCMATIVSKSKDTCAFCGKFNKNVQIVGKKPRLVATACLECAYERLDDEKPPKTKSNGQAANATA